MSEPKKRPKSVKPKAIKVWCPIRSDGAADERFAASLRTEAECREAYDAHMDERNPRPIRQFTLTPVRRKKR